MTIENVDRVDAQHIIVANDNNLPFSSGRTLSQQDNNEFIVLNVKEMLRDEIAEGFMTRILLA